MFIIALSTIDSQDMEAIYMSTDRGMDKKISCVCVCIYICVCVCVCVCTYIHTHNGILLCHKKMTNLCH